MPRRRPRHETSLPTIASCALKILSRGRRELEPIYAAMNAPPLLPVEHIYLIHYRGNAARLEFQLKHLPILGVNASVVSAFDAQDIEKYSVRSCKALVGNRGRIDELGKILLPTEQLSASIKLFVALFDMLFTRRRVALVAEDDVEVDLNELPSLWVGLHDIRVKAHAPATDELSLLGVEDVDLATSEAAALRFLARSGEACSRSNFSRYAPARQLEGIWQPCNSSRVAKRQCEFRSHPAPWTVLFSGAYAPSGYDASCCTTGIVHPKLPRTRNGFGLQAAVGNIISARGAYQYLQFGLPITDAIDYSLADSRCAGANATLPGHWHLKPYLFRPARQLQQERMRRAKIVVCDGQQKPFLGACARLAEFASPHMAPRLFQQS